MPSSTGAGFTDEVAALWQEVAANPDDDGARAVLADLLQAAGDPRGELIASQLLSAELAAAPERQQRIEAILATHHQRWLGPLREVLCAARFDRGFLQAITLSSPWRASDPRWQRPLANRTLLTVEELLRGGVRGDVYAMFMTSPVMPALRRIEVFDLASLAGLERCARPIAHVAYKRAIHFPFGGGHGTTDDDADGAYLPRLYAECDRRASIQSVATTPDLFAQLRRQRWFERLTAVTVECSVRRTRELWARVHDGASLTIVPSAGLEPCSKAFPYDYRVTLERVAGQVVARLAGEWLVTPLATLASSLPELSRIEVEHTSDQMAARVRDAVARREVEVIVHPPRRAGNLKWAAPASVEEEL